MDILNQIIAAMEKEELRSFSLISRKSHDSEDRKDKALFDYIRRSGKKYNERKILKKLYPQGEKNSFYRLKNRLLIMVGKSMLQLHWENEEALFGFHQLSLAILFRKRQMWEPSEYYLKKAKIRAIETGDLELLDMVLGEFIQLSYNLSSINPEEIIAEREENRNTQSRLREMDNIIAVMTWRIRFSGNLSGESQELSPMMEKTIQEFSGDTKLTSNIQFRTRLYQALSKQLIQTHQYVSLETYVKESYDSFMKMEIFSRKNHDLKLQVLTTLLNALLKNKKWDEALKWSEDLHMAMQEFGNLYFDRYLIFYYNSLASIWSKKDISKSVQILEELLKFPVVTQNPLNTLFTTLNLAVIYFGSKKPAMSLKYLVQMHLLDAWKETDNRFRMQVALFELMPTWEQNEEETLDYKCKMLVQQFGEILDSQENLREKTFFELVKRGNEIRKGKKKKDFGTYVEHFLSTFPEKEEDFYSMNEWVASRLIPLE